jgi:type I restriction enzyme S subunit
MELTVVEGWQVTKLSSLAEKIMVGIASAATHAYRAKGIPMFRNQDIKSGYLDDKDLLFISPEYEVAFQNKRLRTGDLVTMRTGYPGVTAIVPSQYDQSQSFTTLITRPKKDAIDSLFLCHYINSEFGKKFFEQSQIGGAQKNVNASTLREMPIPVPTRQEQLAIGRAFSDVDALIAGLEKLIAKKRNLKQAAMQQLLTGQTRLPGFSGEWEVKRLGDICEISMGRTPSRLNPAFWGAGHVWLSIADLHGKVLSSSKEQVTPLAASSMRVIPKGTLLMSFKLSIGRLCFAGCDLYTNEAICGFNNLLANPDYLYYALSRTDFSLYGKQAVKGYTLNKKSLALVEVAYPSDKEQQAIANVLSSMDKELLAVESYLSKTRDLKQGMMQELLTGRTRLV